MELISERVSNSLKLLRKEAGHLSQAEAAKRIGATQQTWGNWEARRSVPEQAAWTRICDAYGKDLAWFFMDHSEPIEIVRGPLVEKFRSFLSLFGPGGNGLQDVKRMGIPMRPKTSPRLRPGFSC